MPDSLIAAKSSHDAAGAESGPRHGARTWIIYLFVFIVYLALFHLTEPEASYQANITFQKLVAIGVGYCLVRALLALGNSYNNGQAMKVLFWAGFLVYILSDVVVVFRRLKFAYFPEALVVCYVFAVILLEKQAKTPPPPPKKKSRKGA